MKGDKGEGEKGETMKGEKVKDDRVKGCNVKSWKMTYERGIGLVLTRRREEFGVFFPNAHYNTVPLITPSFCEILM